MFRRWIPFKRLHLPDRPFLPERIMQVCLGMEREFRQECGI